MRGSRSELIQTINTTNIWSYTMSLSAAVDVHTVWTSCEQWGYFLIFSLQKSLKLLHPSSSYKKKPNPYHTTMM